MIDATVAFENQPVIAFRELQEFIQAPRDGRWSIRV
jgi:hypothetical protein